MVTPEGKVKNEVKKIISKVEDTFDITIWTYWPVPYGYGRSTVDCLGCINGRFFAVETKAEGEVPTTRQEVELAGIRHAAGTTFVIEGTEDPRLLELLDWLISKLPVNAGPP